MNINSQRSTVNSKFRIFFFFENNKIKSNKMKQNFEKKMNKIFENKIFDVKKKKKDLTCGN